MIPVRLFVQMLLIGIVQSVFSLSMQDVRDMPANSWLQVPNSRLDASPEAAPNYFSSADWDKIRGYSGFSSLFEWSGGAFDTKRNQQLIWGGGHNGYRGNELYAFNVNTMIWKRLTDPCLNYANNADPNPDGTPNSRHTWNGLAYIAHADRFFGMGGALNSLSGGCGAPITWTFDFDLAKWANRNPTGTRPPTACGNTCAYDPVSKKVYFGDAANYQSTMGLFSYDYNINVWTKNSDQAYYEEGFAIDPGRRLLIVVGNGKVFAHDLNSLTLAFQTWTTTGGDTFVAGKQMGLEYDPVADRVVGWNGGSVYALNLDTKVWTVYSASGAPTAVGAGTYGAWRYVPKVNAFIVVAGVNQNVAFFKLTAGGGITQSFKPPSRPIVSAHPVNFRLYDLRGRMAGTFTGNNQKAFRQPIGLNRVVYLMQTIDGNKKVVDKVIIIDK
jgi:hypothetical protein